MMSGMLATGTEFMRERLTGVEKYMLFTIATVISIPDMFFFFFGNLEEGKVRY